MIISSICIIALTAVFNSGPVSGAYDGYYDLSAKDTAYLCSLMGEYKKTGKQPDITSNPPTDLPKDKYIASSAKDKCWKMRWYPCADEDITKQKPCGWYKMESAPESECT